MVLKNRTCLGWVSITVLVGQFHRNIHQSFNRSFALPNSADIEHIGANYENGILRIYIPKKEEAKPRPMRTIAIA